MTTLHAALEVGTSRTVLALGEAENGGRPRVTCVTAIPSAGIRKSQILDISQATQSIRGVVQETERKLTEAGSTLSLGNAFLVVSGQDIRTDPFAGTTPIGGTRVKDADMHEAIESARTMRLDKDRELLDIVEQDYVIDAMGGVLSPVGMSGRTLKLNTLHIHADRNRIENARTAANGAHLEIHEPLFAATCAAEVTLEEHERKNGVLLLDLGGGTTGFAAYCDGYLVDAGSIGVGGDHITNDIATAFQMTQAQAEILKRTEASAVLRTTTTEDPRVRVSGSSPLLESRTVSRRAVDTVTNARLRELFAIIRERLEGQDLMQRLHAGVVITGGGAELNGIEALIERELGMDVRPGRPIHIDGANGCELKPVDAPIAGALLYALRNYEEKPFLNGLFGGLFK